MASQQAALVRLRPSIVRRYPLCLFRQQKPQQQWQPAQRFVGMLARPGILVPFPFSRRTLSLATSKLASSRSYSTPPPYQPVYQEPNYQPPPPQPQRSRIWRVAVFLFRAWIYISIGSVVGKYATALVLYPRDDEVDLKLVTHEDEEAAKRITDHILHHPLVGELENDPHYHATHPHYKVPAIFRVGNVTADTLIGPGLMAVPPFIWQDDKGEDLVMVLHVGKGLCGHPDIVHGGFVATLLDETLARCCFKAVPYEIAMTATLKIDYRAPTPANSFLVLRAHTERVEGRKAFVKGRLETLPEPGSNEPGTLLAEAEGLFVSPRSARAIAGLRAFAGMGST
ncbi:hypothetical protein SCUCBS95973_000523 [Sporothrix curviconia]|uniref:Thioesterase domain-containing protein n=1 Tax=Sporothrix curviconia TaxID=1260050 RepID=A0ABP0AR67_9PEZI